MYMQISCGYSKKRVEKRIKYAYKTRVSLEIMAEYATEFRVLNDTQFLLGYCEE